MEQPVYLLLKWAADLNGLLWMVEANEDHILAFLALASLVICLFGFYCYRGAVAALAFTGVTIASCFWARPAWGALTCVTISGVVGVVLGFLAFRFYRFGAVSLCTLITLSWMWQLMDALALPRVLEIILMVLVCLAAAVVTFLFPLWSVIGFTSVWGGFTFAAVGGHLIEGVPQLWNPLAVVIALVLSLAGLLLQLRLFKKQTLFARIMPKKMQHRLEQRQIKEAEAA